MSHVIAGLQKPTLVLCHNKTLAAQLTRELRSFLGEHSAVELFVSYYDHYIPESFKETTGRYIAKKSSINNDINALRHSATRALLTRRDVVVVATVSCIYGLGLPNEYLDASVEWEQGQILPFGGEVDEEREMETDMGQSTRSSKASFSQSLREMRYQLVENDEEFKPGAYQHLTAPRGGDEEATLIQYHQITLWPPYDQFPVSVWFEEHQQLSSDANCNGRQYYRISSVAQGTPQGMVGVQSLHIFPAAHHVVSEENLEKACCSIEEELHERMRELNDQGKSEESARLQARVLQDLSLLRENGFCSGMENYSRHMTGRDPGEPPDTLLDFMARTFSVRGSPTNEKRGSVNSDWLLIVDESHVTLPQVAAMYRGDQSRKRSLIDNGYRLPSALDNRPLNEKEFWKAISQTLFVSATPGKKELDMLNRDRRNLLNTEKEDNLNPVDMVIRPTYVCDPIIEVRPKTKSVQDLTKEIAKRVQSQERSLVVTLTKRDSEDFACTFIVVFVFFLLFFVLTREIAAYLAQQGIQATFIHSGVKTEERSFRIRQLQGGEVDVIVGVNCLREGLDLPEVSLVAVLNADSEGFLRSDTALLQVVGRAARNKNGLGIFYADRITCSMKRCMDLTHTRRQTQLAYNNKHSVTPQSTKGSSTMSIFELLEDQIKAEQHVQMDKGNRNDGLEMMGFLDLHTAKKSTSTESQAPNVNGKLIDTDHIPSSPGVYLWKDEDGGILYIGKASKLRSRIRSYLSPSANHGPRIHSMVQKAVSVEFTLTPSDRDALVLESKLIKRHRPQYNVLMKDDEHYPYICATVGDKLPLFRIVPHIPSDHHDVASSNYSHRYFGPYTNYQEINKILEGIEEKFGLREKSFLVRQGSGFSVDEYNSLFQKVLSEVFTSKSHNSLQEMRSEYEEAGLLFDSPYNECRDVVTVVPVPESNGDCMVHVVQLRQGCVIGEFSYVCEVGPLGDGVVELAESLQMVLEDRHYPSGGEIADQALSWFPNNVLLPFEIPDPARLRNAMKSARIRMEPKRRGNIQIQTPCKRGKRVDQDKRALHFAEANAQYKASQRSLGGFVATSIDGTAVKELARLLSLPRGPSRIECYDISHTQGEQTVGSRVVFVDGKPAPKLYRTFNIKGVDGIDDYESLAEVMRRRFSRAQIDETGTPVEPSDPWAIPDLVVIDGGRGQLGAALKGISHVTRPNFPSIPICALAKGQEDLFVPNSATAVNGSPNSPALLLLRHLRDESHRFALKAHRNRRFKNLSRD